MLWPYSAGQSQKLSQGKIQKLKKGWLEVSFPASLCVFKE